ncbi:DUF1707 domain-containing protein [Spirillospora sp. NPDC047279]|uniref:DUF1707 SHOCT-like domain-containing protein n=1 Tax=Spirillospora sp. NPDC047279 TaxID=3155478 RepID=UPI0033CBDE22
MGQERAEPALRASDRDRDALLVRLHTAYAEGRLTERELDERIDLVLASRTHGELDRLAADLPPAPGTAKGPSPVPVARTGLGTRFQLACKQSVRRSGRWRVPETYASAAYKGGCLLDLRDAEWTGRVTTLLVVAYKSTVEIIVPPGVRVEVGGVGVSADLSGPADADPQVVQVRGIAYKGRIDVKDYPPGHERS